MDDLLRMLRDRGAISTSEYEELKHSATADKERVSREVSGATRDTVKVSTGKSGLKVSSGDGDFRFQLGGRVMIDAAFYDKDETRLGNGAEVRRACLFARGYGLPRLVLQGAD
ncbi:MAG: hypothetical protein ACE5FQ_10575 [Thiogranum sp.]